MTCMREKGHEQMKVSVALGMYTSSCVRKEPEHCIRSNGIAAMRTIYAE